MVAFRLVTAAVAATALQLVSGFDTLPHIRTKPVLPPADHVAVDTSRLRRQAPVIGKLNGLFVAECQTNASSWFSGDGGKVSSAKTLQYSGTVDPNGDETYEVDYTEYSGAGCDPSSDRVLAKYNIKGVVKFHGVNTSPPLPKELDQTYKAEWTTTNSTWFFPASKDPQVTQVLAELNAYCPCGGDWVAGQWRSIDPDTCEIKGRPGAANEFPYLCYLVNGTTSYGTYKWENPAPAFAPKTYQSSAVQFTDIVGYSSVPVSTPRYQLPEGGVTDENDCNVGVWFECGNAVQESAKYCEGCKDLECTGCMYRYEEQDIQDSKFWAKCCPCNYYYADRLAYGDFSWMKVKC